MHRPKVGWVLALLVVWSTGCPSPPTAATDRGEKDEKAVRETFATLQQAVEKLDAEQVLALLDADSRARMESAARAKSKNARDLLKDDLLHEHPYDEYPDGKLTRVTVQGETATAEVAEPDGDKYRLTFVREEGAWKVKAPKTSK
jgi:hypothetical protein